MNLNPKDPIGTDSSTSSSAAPAKRSSWLSNKLSGRPASPKPKEAHTASADKPHDKPRHMSTPALADANCGFETAATAHERDSFADLMDKTKGMTPEQLKAFLAKDEKEKEEKFHETAGVGRWQWVFKDGQK